MNTKRWASTIGLIVTFALVSWAETITHSTYTDPGSHEVEIWEIREPDVNVPQKEYPAIRYRPRDIIAVEAGGCVQTGGHGDTCKHYVDPKGTDANKYYSGLLYLKSAFELNQQGQRADTPVGQGMARIGTAIGKRLFISGNTKHDVPPDLYIRLGYQDDDYGKNGYYEPDDGNDDQCKDQGWAWVRFTITHATAAEIAQAEPPRALPKAPMDMWWDQVDDNAFPLNPAWGAQVKQDGTIDSSRIPNPNVVCNNFAKGGDSLNLQGGTTQSPTFDEPWSAPAHYAICRLFDDPHVVHGHVNWGFATYTGRIFFEDYQRSPNDLDYDFAIVRATQEGITTGNDFQYHNVGPIGLTAEMDSTETITYFDDDWWNSFHHAVNESSKTCPPAPESHCNWTLAQQSTDGHKAIVIGLMGVDTQHGAKAELHPIYALAIQTAVSPAEETWAIMARNWGDEGFCSQDQHYLPVTSLSLFFPDTVSVNDNGTSLRALSLHGSPAGITWGAKTFSDGVVVTVHLSQAQERSLINGHIRFSRNPNGPPPDSLATLQIDAVPGLYKKIEMLAPHATDEGYGKLAGVLSGHEQKSFAGRVLRLNQKREQIARSKLSAFSLVPGPARDDSIVAESHNTLKPEDPRILKPLTPDLQPFDADLAAYREEVFRDLAAAVGGEGELMRRLREYIRTNDYSPAAVNARLSRIEAAIVGKPRRSEEPKHPASPHETNQQAINRLFTAIDTCGCKFLRNSRVISPRDMSEHLRRKYAFYKNAIQTPRDFIDVVASRSVITGERYSVITAAGNELPLANWLEAILARSKTRP